MSESEISSILTELESLMGALRGNVDALQGILTAPEEAPGDQPAPA